MVHTTGSGTPELHDEELSFEVPSRSKSIVEFLTIFSIMFVFDVATIFKPSKSFLKEEIVFFGHFFAFFRKILHGMKNVPQSDPT